MAYRRSNPFKERLQSNPKDINKKVKEIEKFLRYYYDPLIRDDYKQHFSEENSILKSYFPEVDFLYEGRIKNQNSIEEKIHRKISQGNTGKIYDIYAKKIVIHSVNGLDSEDLLIDACYKIMTFLNTYNDDLILLPDKSKDYIKFPKPNNYQALHTIRKHMSSRLPSYMSEVQIRTFRMEEFQKFGTASHMLSYKPKETLKKELCPVFLEIGKTGKTYELSKKASWNKYKSDYDALQEYFFHSRV